MYLLAVSTKHHHIIISSLLVRWLESSYIAASSKRLAVLASYSSFGSQFAYLITTRSNTNTLG
jgi:hypothetical protein